MTNNRWTQRSLCAARQTLASLARQPLVSVLFHVGEFEPKLLEIAVASMRSQVYPQWELCLSVNGTTPLFRQTLKNLCATEPRIKVVFREQPDKASLAGNAAAGLARGEYLVFLNPHDVMEPDYLLEVVSGIVTHPDGDVFYTDEDEIDVAGLRRDPNFKPDWSPELLLSCMYLGHAFGVRRSLFMEIGGFRADFDAAAHYDLALRITEKALQVVHIPRLLYHRRLPTPTLPASQAWRQGVCAVQEALQRRGVAGIVSRTEYGIAHDLDHYQIDFPDTGGRVAIVIPTRNRLELLSRCVQSIRTHTTYDNYEIVIVDNDSDEPDTLAYLADLPNGCRVLPLSCPKGRFNYAWLNNEAVKHLASEYVLFLNNDTEVRRPEWLSQLVGYAQMSGVGAVGARLLFPDETMQHAGIITGMSGGMCSPAFRWLPANAAGYQHYPWVARNCSAVTAACLLMRRELFEQMNGFDEVQFAVAYNDVDLGLRLRDQGWRSVFAPRAELFHYEGASRGRCNDNPHEVMANRRSWGQDQDPYYNPNLSSEHERFAIGIRRTRLRLDPHHLPIRMLLCTSHLQRDGAGLNLLELARGLKDRGLFAPEVYAAADGPLAARYAEAGIPLHLFPEPLAGNSREIAREERITGLAHWLEAHAFGAVYADQLAAFWAVQAAARRGIASLWNIRQNVDWRQHFEQEGGQLFVSAFARAYRVLFASHSTRWLYHELNTHHNQFVLPTGLRPEPLQQILRYHSPEAARRRSGFPLNKVVVSIVGAVSDRKRQHDFAKAAVELLRRGRGDVFFAVIGCRRSAYQDELEALIRPYSAHFALVPETDECLYYLRASDVLVCCSSNESYPRVILEALTFGVPIISTPVCGIAEQVVHNFSALLYPVGDVGMLTEHLQRLVSEPAERRRLGEGGAISLEILTGYEEHLAAVEQWLLEAFLAGGEGVAEAQGTALYPSRQIA